MATDPTKLTDAEREELAKAWYEHGPNAHLRSVKWEDLPQAAHRDIGRNIASFAPHIERILTARLAAHTLPLVEALRRTENAAMAILNRTPVRDLDEITEHNRILIARHSPRTEGR